MTYESSRCNCTDGDRRCRRGGSVRRARRECFQHRWHGQRVRDRGRRGFGELDRRPYVPEHDEHDGELSWHHGPRDLAVDVQSSDQPGPQGAFEAPVFFLRHGT